MRSVKLRALGTSFSHQVVSALGGLGQYRKIEHRSIAGGRGLDEEHRGRGGVFALHGVAGQPRAGMTFTRATRP